LTAHDPDLGREAEPGRPPVADYDHMTVRGVESIVGTLELDDLEALLRYESAHQHRTPVIRLLTSRLHEVRAPGPTVTRVGGYGPAPAGSRPGHSIPGSSRAGRPPLPPPGRPEADTE